LLEASGYECVNSAQSTRLANDKLETARFLDTLGIPTPRTARAEDFEKAFAGALYPLVAKPRHGRGGVGVTLAESPLEAKRIAETELPEGDEWIFQEYIAASRGRDMRVFFADGRIVACVERRAPDGEFASNASLGGTMRELSFGDANGADSREPWASMVRTIACETGLRYGTVDFLYLEGDAGFTVCEINAAPGFEALEGATGLDIAGLLVDLLIFANQ
jgi:RimK family alpha-L-glutamate ligase